MFRARKTDIQRVRMQVRGGFSDMGGRGVKLPLDVLSGTGANGEAYLVVILIHRTLFIREDAGERKE